MSERTSKWGPWTPESVSSKPSAQPYSIQSANRGSSSWADWVSEVRIRSQSIEFPGPTHSAGGGHAGEGVEYSIIRMGKIV